MNTSETETRAANSPRATKLDTLSAAPAKEAAANAASQPKNIPSVMASRAAAITRRSDASLAFTILQQSLRTSSSKST